MAGTKEGAAKARAKMKEKYGEDWARQRSLKAATTAKLRHGADIHARSGSEGGKIGGSLSGGNFKHNPKRASKAGRISSLRRIENRKTSADSNNNKGEQ